MTDERKSELMQQAAVMIAAAPEMLDALIDSYIALEYVSDYDIPLCTKDKIKNVIEKATGITID